MKLKEWVKDTLAMTLIFLTMLAMGIIISNRFEAIENGTVKVIPKSEITD